MSEGIRGYGFEGRVALVTGAAGGGIGEATARRLVREGATVVVTDVHEERTESVVEALRAEARDATVVGFPLDAGDRAGIDRVVAAVREQLGPIDILVNNAAVNVLGPMAGYATRPIGTGSSTSTSAGAGTSCERPCPAWPRSDAAAS